MVSRGGASCYELGRQGGDWLGGWAGGFFWGGASRRAVQVLVTKGEV